MSQFVVYRPSDRIRLSFEGSGITLVLAPLSHEQRIRLASQARTEAGAEVSNANQIYSDTLKMSIKGIEGVDLRYPDGSKFELDFEADALTEASLDCLTQVFETEKLAGISLSLLRNKLKFELVDGVEVEARKTKKKQSPQ